MNSDQINKLRKLRDEIQTIIDEEAKAQLSEWYEVSPYIQGIEYSPVYIYPRIVPLIPVPPPTPVQYGDRNRTNQRLTTNGYQAAY